MAKIFDTHAHYDDHAFDADRDEVLKGLAAQGVGTVVNASARASDIPRILELTKKYDFLYGMAGLHPTELYAAEDTELVNRARDTEDPDERKKLESGIHPAGDAEFKMVEAALSDPKIVAIGEIGLDYHYPDTDKKRQRDWFERQIDLALRKGYPISVHSRDAAADTLSIIRGMGAAETGGVIHCFSYEIDMAKLYLDMGFYLGVGGVVTYKNARKLKEIVAYMPLDRLVLETDCPYLSPVPLRGTRNHSGNINYVVNEISNIIELDRNIVIMLTEENARRLYRL